MRLLAAIILTANLVLLWAGLGAAQQPFHLTFHRAPDEPSSLVLVGNVSNDGSRNVVDVWVTADALDARGRVVARGLAFVTSQLPGRASRAFTVKLPRAEEAHSFRVFVSSFRYMFATESP
jgi:hypothetical protein